MGRPVRGCVVNGLLAVAMLQSKSTESKSTESKHTRGFNNARRGYVSAVRSVFHGIFSAPWAVTK